MCNNQSIKGQKWLSRTRQAKKLSNEYLLQRALSQCQFMKNTPLLRSVGTISNRSFFLCVILLGMAVDTGNSSLKKKGSRMEYTASTSVYPPSGPDWRINLNRSDYLNFEAKGHRTDHTVLCKNIAFYGLKPWIVKVQTAIIFNIIIFSACGILANSLLSVICVTESGSIYLSTFSSNTHSVLHGEGVYCDLHFYQNLNQLA
jgi:hypothetical protein